MKKDKNDRIKDTFKDVLDNRWLCRYIRFIETYNNVCVVYEKHHILPRKIYPQYSKCSWNIVKLSPRAHYISHYMLAMAIGGNMWYAWNLMNHTRGHKLKSRLYEIGRKNHSIVASERMKKCNPMFNQETIEKVRLANTGNIASFETRAKMSLQRKGKPLGYKHTEDSKDKMRQARLEQECPRNGKRHSKETKQKLKEMRKPKGRDHPRVSLILIYNRFGGLEYFCKDTFNVFCEKNNLPLGSFKRCYQSNSLYYARVKKYKKFDGFKIIRPKNIKWSQK